MNDERRVIGCSCAFAHAWSHLGFGLQSFASGGVSCVI